jgi:cytochrome P450
MLGGQFIPEGATVSTQAYTLHRNPFVFVDPDKFWPQRWESPSQEMKDAYMPYGGGTRGKSKFSALSRESLIYALDLCCL